ncbi:MAG: DUF1289 domain-containing protein [Bacteriovoracaceae bacterium]|nr:DUF1289 domain-containing protein [Bacteriovoracaceae bacterium]
MIKTGDQKDLSDKLREKQKSKGTYDSPCLSICDYEGVFKQCATCRMRKAEKSAWKSGDSMMKDTILRAIGKRSDSSS